MKLKIINESLFDKPSDAVILSIDGYSKGMGGRAARSFEKLYPDIWGFIENHVKYPVPLGFSVPIIIPQNNIFNMVFLVSTLSHNRELKSKDLKSVSMQSHMFTIQHAIDYNVKTIRCGLPTGGWRIDDLNAFMIISDLIEKTRSTTRDKELQVCIQYKNVFDKVKKFAQDIGY